MKNHSLQISANRPAFLLTWPAALLALALLPEPAAGQYLDMELSGPSEGLTQPWKTMFQSHNQKVVENANGIFCTTHGVALDRSTDGGQTFSNVYDRNLDHEAYRPPTLETDEDDNLYLIYPYNGKTRFEKFTAANGYTSPTIVTEHSQATSAAKFASAYDPGRGRLYHATQDGYFFSFDKSGNVVDNKQVWTGGSTGAAPQYPHLFLDTGGVLHFAQTTVDGATGTIYETIRYLRSTDGGATWKKMDGTVVSTPVSCDPDSGNSTEISLEDEEGVNTWLANMFVKNGKVHFQYRARGLSPERQHYMRFDQWSGVREIDSWTDFSGGAWSGGTLTINSISGCFASDTANPDAPLVAIAAVAGDRIGALASYDNGSTWQDHARSADVDLIDCVGSFRFSPQYGRVIGTFSGAPGGIWATALFYQFPIPSGPSVEVNSTGVQPVDQSWDTGSGWDDGNPAASGNDYFILDTHVIRTPVGSGNFVFPGESLTINSGGQLLLKNQQTVTMNLISEGGLMTQGSVVPLNPDTARVDGTVTLNGDLDVDTIESGRTIEMLAPIGGTGTLTKTGAGTLTLENINTHTGGTTVNGGTLALNSTSGDDCVIRGTLTVNSAGTVLIGGNDWIGLGNDAAARVTTLNVAGGTVNNTKGSSWIRGAAVNLTGGSMTGGEYHWISSSLNSLASDTTATFGSYLHIRKDYGSSDLTIDVADGSAAIDLLISGQIKQTGGAAAVTKTGAGVLRLSGSNIYTGATAVNAGTVNVSGNQSAANGGWSIGKGNPATSTVNFQAGSTVAASAGKTIQVGSIPGDTFTTTAGQQLNVAGGVTNGGTLAIGRNSTVNINSGANWTQNGGMSMDGIGGYSASLNVNAGGLFTYAGSSSIKVNPADSNSGNSILTIGGTFVTGQGFERTATGTGSGQVRLDGGTLGLSGNVADLTVNSGAMPFTFSLGGGGGTIDTDGHAAAVSGVISGSGGLIKTGAGTLTLSGVNSYNGGTNVNEGTLSVTGSLSASGSVTVAPGATLTGTGIVGGSVSAAGTVAPGASAGTLTTGPAILTGTLAIEIDGASGDKLLSTGVIDLTGAALTVTELGGGFTQPSYVIAEGTSISGPFASVPAGYAVTIVPGGTGQQAVLTTGGSFATWASANAPGQTMAMDHDEDGVPNGIEYFMGETGSGFTAMPAPDASRTVSWTKDAAYTGAYGSDYLVETSTNLVDWDPVPVGEVSIGATVDYTIPNDGSARFARLKVTGP